ncbi:cystine/glutamate transporter-like isoform X2 [Hyla sarda]|uniref:cystine/glutamate transporter-like isoform X2 n=1 Tax=Hyla sarda TaxID=327740 RepID=UPI0024C41275|nr:cystine/glutamate transporter-like isoform X2 [Hyla sarda]
MAVVQLHVCVRIRAARPVPDPHEVLWWAGGSPGHLQPSSVYVGERYLHIVPVVYCRQEWSCIREIELHGALSYADLGTSIKKSGGHYIYLLETLGPVPAFLRLWAEFVMIRPANIAVVCLAFGRYLIEPLFVPCNAPPITVKLISAIGIAFLIALNCWSVTWSANLQTTFTVLKFVAIGLIIIPGLMALAEGKTENFQNAFDTSSLALDKIPLAFYSGMFAFGGWFYITFVTEEIVNPERNIPITVILSLIIVTVCYLLTNVSYYTILTPSEVLSSEAVAMTFADHTLPQISPVISILVAMSCFGALNGGIFASSRMLFAASREGHWPNLFSMIHIRRHTPLPALLLMMPLVFLMISIGDLYGLMNFYSFSRWLFMGLVTFGLIIHRRKHPDLPRPFKVPLVIPIIFSTMCLFIVGMSLYSDPVNTGIGCLITLSGLPVYYLTIHNQQMPRRLRETFNLLTLKMQVLLEVIPQERKTY